MSDLKPTGTKLKLGKNEYGLRFTINAIDDIQSKYDIAIADLPKLFKDSKDQIKNLRYLLTLLINENIDCENDGREEQVMHVDERYVGRHIDVTNMSGMISTIYRTFSDHLPESDKTDEDANPNAMSGQQKN